MKKTNDKIVAEKLQRAKNQDGWTNVLTSIGVKGKDKRLAATVKWERGSRDNFEHFYAADDVAGNVVDVIPDEAMSKGYKIIGIEDAGLVQKITHRLTELRLNENANEAWKLSRIHGGAAIIKITEDARLELPMPLNKKILALNVVDRWDLYANSTDIDGEITSKTYKMPLVYRLQTSEGNAASFLTINASRVVRFDGAYLPRRLMRQNQYWGDSILTKLENPIRNYQISNDAAALTIQDFDIPVLKLRNMSELMSSNCDSQVVDRLNMVNLSKSLAKMIVLDADREDFEHKSRNVTGMKDVLDKIEARLVTATKIPRTKLFGESAGGMGSSGESQASNWYDLLESEQQNFLKPKLMDIIKYVITTEFPNVDISKVDIEFTPLWQMSEKEEADLRKVIADTDAVYIGSGVVDPTEVALSRFGGGKFNKDMIIQEDLREASAPIEEYVAPEPKKEIPVVKTENLDWIKEDLKMISSEISDLKKDKPKKTADLVLRRGYVYDSEVDLKTRDNSPMDLDGYKFEFHIEDSNNQVVHIHHLDRTDVKGQLRIMFKKSVVRDLFSHRQDSESEVLLDGAIMMIRPNGTKKIVKKYVIAVCE